MLKSLICLAILIAAALPAQSGGYITNQTIKKDLIVNGGADAWKINNSSVLKVCHDGCDYSSIQSAIINATPWSTIETPMRPRQRLTRDGWKTTYCYPFTLIRIWAVKADKFMGRLIP